MTKRADLERIQQLADDFAQPELSRLRRNFQLGFSGVIDKFVAAGRYPSGASLRAEEDACSEELRVRHRSIVDAWRKAVETTSSDLSAGEFDEVAARIALRVREEAEDLKKYIGRPVMVGESAGTAFFEPLIDGLLRSLPAEFQRDQALRAQATRAESFWNNLRGFLRDALASAFGSLIFGLLVAVLSIVGAGALFRACH